jgi:Glyoxalase/Bleomycin resistance protein/Dioxygenase superfamily
MRVSKLAYLGANATDVDAWRKYSSDVLGLEIGTDSSDRLLYLRADERHHRLSIHEGKGDDLAYVGWEVTSHEALEAIAATLDREGTRVEPGKPNELADRRAHGADTRE